MSIKEPNNILLLKQLLQENALNMTNPSLFKNEFNTQLNTIYDNRFKYKSDLIKMNKTLLSNMEKVATRYTSENNNSFNDQYPAIKLNPRNHVDNQFNEPTEDTPRITIIEQKFKEQKKEFDALNSIPTPEEVDFGDNVTETIMKDEDYDIKMKQRERDLSEIMKGQSNKTNNNWLKGENTLTEARKYNQETKYPQAQSPQARAQSPQARAQSPINKRVRFISDKEVEPISSSNFFNKLKTTKHGNEGGNNISNVITDKQEILNNQREILNNQREILNNQREILNNQREILNNESGGASSTHLGILNPEPTDIV